jgi:hypothetical protein
MAGRYVNYDELLNKRAALGLDEVSKIDKVNALNFFIDTLRLADVVEVKRGYWKTAVEPLGFTDVACAECSACGESWIIGEDFTIEDYIENWRFCPCCGAKMDDKGGAADV